MKNSITIQLNNSFKGVENQFKITVPLLFNKSYLEGLPIVLPRRVAEQNGIDTYSYHFEAMEADDVYVIAAEGLASAFIKDAPVALESFIESCQAVSVDDQLAYLVESLLPEMQGDIKLKGALIAAFELGCSQS